MKAFRIGIHATNSRFLPPTKSAAPRSSPAGSRDLRTRLIWFRVHTLISPAICGSVEHLPIFQVVSRRPLQQAAEVSGKRCGIRISRAAWALGLARARSQFSRVRALVQRYPAKSPRDRFICSRSRVSFRETTCVFPSSLHSDLQLVPHECQNSGPATHRVFPGLGAHRGTPVCARSRFFRQIACVRTAHEFQLQEPATVVMSSLR